jgi:hypothetical protein
MNEFLGCSCCPDDGVEPGIKDDLWTTYCTDEYSAKDEVESTDNVLERIRGFKSKEELDKEYEAKKRAEAARKAAALELKRLRAE